MADLAEMERERDKEETNGERVELFTLGVICLGIKSSEVWKVGRGT